MKLNAKTVVGTLIGGEIGWAAHGIPVPRLDPVVLNASVSEHGRWLRSFDLELVVM